MAEELSLPSLVTEEDFKTQRVLEVLADLSSQFPRLSLAYQFLRERSPNPSSTGEAVKSLEKLRKEFDSVMSELYETVNYGMDRLRVIGYVGRDIVDRTNSLISRAYGIVKSAKKEYDDLMDIFAKWAEMRIEEARYRRVT